MDLLFLFMANMSWNSAMNTGETMHWLTDKREDGEYRIPFIVVADTFQSEMTAFADLILPDTTYLERHDAMSMLDRPISEFDGPCDSVRVPVLPPLGQCKPFQEVLVELASRLKFPAFTQDDGHIFCTPAHIEPEVAAFHRRALEVRELATREDTPGETVKLTIDAGLQDYTARRLGEESGSVTVFDCLTGHILAMVSMPAYDPNAFSDGISNSEWRMLSEDDHLPLMNKTLQGLYPPGSTFKPATALAALAAGIDPKRTVYCNGGYTLGNRRFGCLGRHGPMTMHTAIARSCNTYFYTVGREIGIDRIASAARALGFGAEFELPLPSQRYGTIPDEAWKQRRYKQTWTQSDTLNAAIGQGYVLVSPFQLALSAARIASGRLVVPALLHAAPRNFAPLPFPQEHLAVVRGGMDEVVNGAGTVSVSGGELTASRSGASPVILIGVVSPTFASSHSRSSRYNFAIRRSTRSAAFGRSSSASWNLRRACARHPASVTPISKQAL